MSPTTINSVFFLLIINLTLEASLSMALNNIWPFVRLDDKIAISSAKSVWVMNFAGWRLLSYPEFKTQRIHQSQPYA